MKKFLPLVVALALGLCAAWMAMDLIRQKNSLTSANFARRPQVVMAKQAIDAGHALTADDLVLSEINSEIMPPNSFTDVSQLVGRVTTVPIVEGQVISSTLLAPVGSGEGLQATIMPGMRAITLDINEVTGVAGYLSPGCRVDILQTVRDEKTGEQTARTIVQNVKVTQIGMHHTDGQDGGLRSVTLLVTPRQAEVLELASANGRPRLALRGDNDLALTKTRGVTLTDLRTGTTNAPSAEPVVASLSNRAVVIPAETTTRPASDTTWTIRVIRGDSVSDVRFNLHTPDATMTDVR